MRKIRLRREKAARVKGMMVGKVATEKIVML